MSAGNSGPPPGTILIYRAGGRNFGDRLGPLLAGRITGAAPRIVPYPGRYLFFLKKPSARPVYAVVGSIIASAGRIRNVVIWGAGFKAMGERLFYRPAKVCAVRGPLSRAKLLEAGVDCPPVYGDPALLLPRFHRPPKEKRYRLGIVPHFCDAANPLLDGIAEDEGIHVIDVRQEPTDVIDAIASCETIASSSLHGLVVADAYGIPSVWIEFSRGVQGHGFKFYDYFLSVGRPTRGPVAVASAEDLKRFVGAREFDGIDIDLELLWRSCPFRRDALPP